MRTDARGWNSAICELIVNVERSAETGEISAAPQTAPVRPDRGISVEARRGA